MYMGTSQDSVAALRVAGLSSKNYIHTGGLCWPFELHSSTWLEPVWVSNLACLSVFGYTHFHVITMLLCMWHRSLDWWESWISTTEFLSINFQGEGIPTLQPPSNILQQFCLYLFLILARVEGQCEISKHVVISNWGQACSEIDCPRRMPQRTFINIIQRTCHQYRECLNYPSIWLPLDLKRFPQYSTPTLNRFTKSILPWDCS